MVWGFGRQKRSSKKRNKETTQGSPTTLLPFPLSLPDAQSLGVLTVNEEMTILHLFSLLKKNIVHWFVLEN